MTSSIGTPLLNWYQEDARHLPWRAKPDPYPVWVAEIMLQQTRVETVIPYFERWMARFPDLETLAAATQGEVLAVWEGLGYYARARNLLRAAQIVTEKYDGQLPRDVKSLRQLPGIGRYTAGAIASIAFGVDEATLDGNIRRVLARHFNMPLTLESSEGEKRLWELAAANLVPGRAGDYNQALMDLGAVVCIPRNPLCSSCPISDTCQANALGIQDELPVKTSRAPIPHHTVTAAIIQRAGKVLLAQRPPQGLLGGMWEFPGGKAEPGEELIQALEREICEELGVAVEVGEEFGVYQHAYTHFRVSLHAFLCRLNGDEPRSLYHASLTWVPISSLGDFPMGKIDRQIADSLLGLLPD